MLRRVSSERTPAFGPADELGGRRRATVLARRTQEAGIARRERVWLTHRAERNVMCSPLTDAADAAQTRDRFFDGRERMEQHWIGKQRLGQSAKCLLAGARHFELGKLRASDRSGGRKGTFEGARVRTRDGLAVSARQRYREASRRFDGNLL